MFAIGATFPPTDIDTVLDVSPLTGSRLPQDNFRRAAELVDLLDGHVAGQGYPACVWSFGVLTQAMVDQLRALCPGFSADVYIRTRRNDGIYEDYAAIMVWPLNESDSRNPGRRYLGLAFEFRRLSVVFTMFTWYKPEKSINYFLFF
jgi:hypothetical protein